VGKSVVVAKETVSQVEGPSADLAGKITPGFGGSLNLRRTVLSPADDAPRLADRALVLPDHSAGLALYGGGSAGFNIAAARRPVADTALGDVLPDAAARAEAGRGLGRGAWSGMRPSEGRPSVPWLPGGSRPRCRWTPPAHMRSVMYPPDRNSQRSKQTPHSATPSTTTIGVKTIGNEVIWNRTDAGCRSLRSRSMRAIVLLAHSAELDQSANVHALGLGWTTTPTPVPQHALIIFVEVNWSELGKSFPIRAELVDGDGAQVANTEHGVIKARRQPVHPAGTPVTIPFIATIPTLNLTEGQRYQWRVVIDDEMHEDWLASFTVTG
jgi:Family of unknown function (DUF6941)